MKRNKVYGYTEPKVDNMAGDFTEDTLYNALNKVPKGMKIFETDLVAIKQEGGPIHPDDVDGYLSPERYVKQLDAYTKYHAKVNV